MIEKVRRKDFLVYLLSYMKNLSELRPVTYSIASNVTSSNDIARNDICQGEIWDLFERKRPIIFILT